MSALVRRAYAEGGSAAVLARGDREAGAVLLLLAERGVVSALIERALGAGGYAWRETGPADPAGRDAYLARRRDRDPDLWVVEVDHPDARRLVAEVMG